MRASTTSPAILVNFMASKEQQKRHFGGDFDGILRLFLPELKELIQGVRFYCRHLDRVVTVVAAFHGHESDLPERCKGTGFKNPSNCLGPHCPVCGSVRENIAKEFINPTIPALRDSEAFRTEVMNLQREPEGVFKTGMLSQLGLSRISGIVFVDLFFH